MTRSVTEWIGKTDDSRAPPRVRLRVFDREGGICFLTGRKIRPGEKWELHHGIPLILGGENRESNLYPVLVEPHKAETARNVAEKAKIARVRAKHLGIRQPKSRLSHPTLRRTMSGQVVEKTCDRY